MCGASVFNKLKDRNQIIGSVVLFIYIMVLIICDIYYSVHTLLGEMRYKKKLFLAGYIEEEAQLCSTYVIKFNNTM